MSDPQRPAASESPPDWGALLQGIDVLLHGRMLHALEQQWPPLAIEAAYTQIDAMAGRFARGLSQFDDPVCRSFYAALCLDPVSSQ